MEMEFVRHYFDLFSGRPDFYALRLETKEHSFYVPSNYVASEPEKEWLQQRVEKEVRKLRTPEFTEEVIAAHLAGDAFIGVYPLRADSTVNFFAFDFDKKKDDDPDPYEAAVRQAEILWKEAKIPVYVERSQSGNGFHVWGFLAEPVHAGKLRHALRPFIEMDKTYDRMFPVQPSLGDTEKNYGNLIALPLHGGRREEGKSVFVRRGEDGRPEVIADQEAFLFNVALIPAEDIERLFQEAPESYDPEKDSVRERTTDPEALRGGWKLMDERFGCEFVRWAYENPSEVDEPLWYALACNFAQLADGREMFHEVSAQDSKRYNARATDRKFDQALRVNKPHTCSAIRDLGGNCHCDERFPKRVVHPFDLARIPFKELAESLDAEDTDSFVQTGLAGILGAIEWAEAVERDPSIGQGIPYGIKSIDEATGLRDSDLVIWAARPGMGKTALALFVADDIAMRDIPVYFFSLEMSEQQLYKRLLSVRAEVSQTRMAKGALTSADWDRINKVQAQIERDGYRFYVDDMSRSTDRVFEVAASLVHEHGKGVIFFDYLQLSQRLPRESQFDAVTRITQDLKLLAKALNVPVVALAQLNRAADDATTDSQTYDSWLRGSGEIEQAADVIAFLLGDKGPGVKERLFAIHKERHRESGMKIPLEFNQPIMRFGEEGTWISVPAMGAFDPEIPTVDDDYDDEDNGIFKGL